MSSTVDSSRIFESASPASTPHGNALLAALNAPRIGGLDFLRAMAVLFVMLGHSLGNRSDMELSVGPLASLGVKIFFVLSGFLITRLLLNEVDRHGRVDFLAFYRRRVARLMPAFYLYLAAAVAVLWVRHKPVPWDAVLSSVLYVTNYYQAFTGAETNIVSHFWSLAVEEQFYVLWPLALAGLYAARMNMARALVIFIVAVWCWRVYLMLVQQVSVDYLYRALDTRGDDLAVGCLTAVLSRSGPWRERLAWTIHRPAAGPALVLMIYASSVLGAQNSVYRYCFGYMVEPFMIGLLLLSTLVASNERRPLAHIVNSRLMVHLGQVSYGAYLFHGMVMYSAQRVVEEHTGSFWLGIVAAFVAIFLVASASWRWFETPMRKWINAEPPAAARTD